MTRNFESISGYYLAQAKPGGGGANVVNVILVDFRGFDTFGEIIVLGIAAVAIFALLDTALRGAAARRLAAMRHPEQARDAHPLLLVVATRVLLPIALTVAIYIFLRGHNAPGGGFIAGLVVAIALIMQYIASGYAWAATRARVDAQAMIGGGVAIAGLTGIAAWYFGRPFLTSAHGAIHLPLIGDVEFASAMGFDLGVMLTVIGAVLLSLRQISRVEQRAEHEPVPEGPMDIQLPTADPERQRGGAGAGPSLGRSRNRSTGAIAEMEALVASAIGLLTAVGVLSGAAAHDVSGRDRPQLSVLRHQSVSAGDGTSGHRPPADRRSGVTALYRPAAAGAGPDRDRDLVRHDRADRRDRAARLSRNRLRPGRSRSRAGA